MMGTPGSETRISTGETPSTGEKRRVNVLPTVCASLDYYQGLE